MDNLAHWRSRAARARQLAARLENPKAKAEILRLAVRYNIAAARAAKRQREREASAQVSVSQQPVADSWLLDHLS